MLKRLQSKVISSQYNWTVRRIRSKNCEVLSKTRHSPLIGIALDV